MKGEDSDGGAVKRDEEEFRLKHAADVEEEDGGEDKIDMSSRKKLIHSAARRTIEHHDPALAQKASKIFDDPS